MLVRHGEPAAHQDAGVDHARVQHRVQYHVERVRALHAGLRLDLSHERMDGQSELFKHAVHVAVLLEQMGHLLCLVKPLLGGGLPEERLKGIADLLEHADKELVLFIGRHVESSP